MTVVQDVPVVPPQIIARTLTFEFDQSVSVPTGQPDILEIAITPLSSGSTAEAGVTFAGGLKTATLELSDPINLVEFNLIPSYSAGLTEPIHYRVMWRTGITGRTERTDFDMPDEDLSWDELISGVGNVIGAEMYLQQSDLGVPGRVARLDTNGNVIDANGIVVPSSADLTVLQNGLNTEVAERQGADADLQDLLESELYDQINATLSTNTARIDVSANNLTSLINAEAGQRQAADTGIQSLIFNTQADLQDHIDSAEGEISAINTALNAKADLDGTGHIPVAQIPTSIITTPVSVPDQAAMLALDPAVVNRGSLAVRPDGVWLLATNDPSQLSNWVSLTTVSSVNGKRGAVVLSATDVNAIPAGGAVAMGQVTGLNTALLGKTDTTTTAAIQAQLNSLQAITANPAVATFLSTGQITDTALPPDVALINSSNQVTKKDGTVIATGTGGGGVALPIPQSGVVNLVSDLAARVLNTDTRLSNARIPTPHATSHVSGGSDPLTLSQGQVTGLSTLFSNNALTPTSNAVNRISALETLVAGGGGTGGGGTPAQTVFYTSANISTDVTDFTQVFLHSPFGIDSDGTITGTLGTWYYLYTGVRPADVAYPYLTPGGHLKLVIWNEANPPDPTWALASDLITTNAVVATKANQSDLTALSHTVDQHATEADLLALTTTVGTKANQSDLNTTNTTVAAKANQSDLAALTATVGTKANQTDMTAVQTQANANTAALSTKADLVAGVLKANQIPTAIPLASITGLAPYLTHLNATAGTFDAAYLSNLANIPTGIPAASITGLPAALTTKADLVGGVIPVNELPPAAITAVYQVANRAAMLALTTAQAQQGDFCVITGTADQGTYILTTNDPTLFANWLPITATAPPVISVNNKTGSVSLTYTDVGAMAANAAIPISQVTGLSSQLSTFALQSALTSGLAGKTSPADVQTMFTNSSFTKRADYVATISLTNLAGQLSVDGVLVPVGALVLTTNQSSSANNGIWVVSAGAWSRPADFATGSYLAKDTLVIVSNQTTAGNGATNYTVWQETAPSGFIDSNANNWLRIGYCAPPFVPVQGNGIAISGSTIAASAQAGGGVLAGAGGLALDTAVAVKKALGTVPSGSTTVGITHGLNNLSPKVVIYDVASNTEVLAGVTATSANAVSIEFGTAPATGQYRYMIIG